MSIDEGHNEYDVNRQSEQRQLDGGFSYAAAAISVFH
jgi:hypothetical protein